jgi:glycosyltransferase involved in cell wall biosynthesis
VRAALADAVPTVSVITVCLNCASLIERTLVSVAQQDLPGIEHVIVDGASSDGTLAVIARHAAAGRHVISEPDRGIAEAFNKGIRASSAPWILMLNAGDTFTEPRSLRTLMSLPREGVTIASARARVSARRVLPPWRIRNAQSLVLKAYVAHQATLVHRSVYERHGLYDESFRIRMDFDFFLRVLRHERLAFSPETLVNYLPGGLSNPGLDIFWSEGRRAVRKNRCGPLAAVQVEALRTTSKLLAALGWWGPVQSG